MPELRQNPATKEWVIIATERAKRPEDFKQGNNRPLTDKCPFCPGNEEMTPPEVFAFRASRSLPNSPNWRVRVTANKYPALSPKGELKRLKEKDFYVHMEGVGQHEIIIESPDHDKTIATMSQKQVEEVFLAYRERYAVICCDKRFEMLIIFKNHGIRAGTSLKHPHSQLIATPVTPMHIRNRIEEAMRYFDDNGTCIYCMIIDKEKATGKRIVMETDNFISFIPFAARASFEVWVMPKEHESSFDDIAPIRCRELAYMMRQVLAKIYYSLNDADYNYIIYSSPCHERDLAYYHWHIKIVPRVASVAGFEIGSGIYINTVIPEHAAEFLRNAKVD
jgi:UDPglucose--hexose-1-phosphate uridylyltransferase